MLPFPSLSLITHFLPAASATHEGEDGGSTGAASCGGRGARRRHRAHAPGRPCRHTSTQRRGVQRNCHSSVFAVRCANQWQVGSPQLASSSESKSCSMSPRLVRGIVILNHEAFRPCLQNETGTVRARLTMQSLPHLEMHVKLFPCQVGNELMIET